MRCWCCCLSGAECRLFAYGPADATVSPIASFKYRLVSLAYRDCPGRMFCSLAVLDPRVGHTVDVLSSFIPVLCHSDWHFHGESCPRLDVVNPGRAWSSSPACTWHCSLHYLFLHGVSSWCDHSYASFLALMVSNSSHFTPALLRTRSFVREERPLNGCTSSSSYQRTQADTLLCWHRVMYCQFCHFVSVKCLCCRILTFWSSLVILMYNQLLSKIQLQRWATLPHTHTHTGSGSLCKWMTLPLLTCYPLYHYISYVPISGI